MDKVTKHLPAILFSLSLAIALNLQDIHSVLVGWWFLSFAACTLSMLCGSLNTERGGVWWTSLLWFYAIGLSGFVLAPAANGSTFMLMAFPGLALAMRREHLKGCLIGALTVVTIYSIGLIVQMLLHVQYTNYNYPGRVTDYPAIAWPLIDPNNAAAVVAMALIPSFYMALRDKRWFALVGIFIFAMFATASKMGFMVAIFGALVFIIERFVPLMAKRWVFLAVLAIIIAAGEGMGLYIATNPSIDYHNMTEYLPYLQRTSNARLLMWEASWPLVFQHPITGLGLGTFWYYYAQVRLPDEIYTSGSFAHNDLLQFAIEMGFPCALIFLGLFLAIFLTIRRATLASGVIMLAIFAMAMTEFQFYVPAVSMLMGLALAYHRLRQKS